MLVLADTVRLLAELVLKRRTIHKKWQTFIEISETGSICYCSKYYETHEPHLEKKPERK
jgi:hypothetical protein